jgi:hypothetical protein
MVHSHFRIPENSTGDHGMLDTYRIGKSYGPKFMIKKKGKACHILSCILHKSYQFIIIILDK